MKGGYKLAFQEVLRNKEGYRNGPVIINVALITVFEDLLATLRLRGTDPHRKERMEMYASGSAMTGRTGFITVEQNSIKTAAASLLHVFADT